MRKGGRSVSLLHLFLDQLDDQSCQALSFRFRKGLVFFCDSFGWTKVWTKVN